MDGTDQDGRSPTGSVGPTYAGDVSRPFCAHADEQIVDRAAALFARRGVAQTSVLAIADAVGLSGAGLLHHFPSKDALRDAALAYARTLGSRPRRRSAQAAAPRRRSCCGHRRAAR